MRGGGDSLDGEHPGRVDGKESLLGTLASGSPVPMPTKYIGPGWEGSWR